MAETKPTGEQIRFRSANTGDHVLDTYLESAEIGAVKQWRVPLKQLRVSLRRIHRQNPVPCWPIR